MADMMTPPVRFARVTTRRMHTQTIQCPLDPEMLVAEFAGELPPDIARHVREHLVFCETCSARSRALRSPYELLSSLGSEPVPYVADLRDSVRVRVRSRRAIHELARFTARLGRGGAITLTGILGLAVIGVFLAVAFLFPAIAGVTTRSQNALTHVPAAAPGGILYAETNKLIPVTDPAGKTWQAAEIIAVDQRTGVVLHSLPASGGTLHVAQPDQLPVAIQMAGKTVVEVTAPGQDGRQALIVFDATTGHIRAITPLTLPDGRALPQKVTGASLAIAPDHTVAYVGLDTPNPRSGGASVLVVSLANGKITGALTPGYNISVPLPPPPGSLPISAFPSTIPYLDVSAMSVTSGLHGALALSPNGQWLFNVLSLTSPTQQHYALIRRFDATTGSLIQELALPGDFSLARLLISSSNDMPEIYLVTGSPDAHCYILDASENGPTLVGDVPLGGPISLPGTEFTGSIYLTLSASGDRLYIAQDATSDDGQITGHDVWVVDVRGFALTVHHSASTSVGMVLPNGSTAKGARAFSLRSGVVSLTDSELTGAMTPWLQLNDGKSVVQLITTEAG
jgi:anti-sigma factor RsiW